MAQLHSVIGSILRDIIAAQHEANLYSYSLSESYGKEGKTRDFQLPGVIISDMELELKYGVNSSDENLEQSNLRIGKIKKFIRELSQECAKIVATVALDTISKNTTQKEEISTVFLDYKQYPDANKQYIIYVARALANSFDGSLRDIVNHETGELLTDVIYDKMTNTLKKKVLNDSANDVLFTGPDGPALRELVATNIYDAIRAEILLQAKDENFKQRKTFPQLDVAITSDELSKLPEEAIHSFKLKFSPTTCNITELDDSSWIDNFEIKFPSE